MDKVGILGIKPDLILALVVFWGFYYRFLPGVLLASLFGYMVDLYSGAPLGVNVISKLLVYYFAFICLRSLFLDSPFFQGAVVFIAVLGDAHLIYFLVKFLDFSAGPYVPFIYFSLSKATYTALLAPVIFLGLNRVRPKKEQVFFLPSSGGVPLFSRKEAR